MNKLECEYTTFIQKGSEAVWDALTQKQYIDLYYICPLVSINLEVRGKINYGMSEDQIFIEGELIEVTVGEKLVHSFYFSENENTNSVVSYELEKIGDELTKLRVVHNQFKGSNSDKLFADVAGGWPVILSGLKSYLETGKGLKFPERK